LDTQFVNIIFGIKLREARQGAGLTLSEFAQRCEISPSYATEVEKGRKYPRVDKIMRMAEVLDVPYNELVSMTLAPHLQQLEGALSSTLISEFPFAEFGLDASDLVALLTKAPAKASALLSALFEIGRQHDLKDEHVLLAALRSYQELHQNYFPDLEEAAAAFAAKHSLWDGSPVTAARLESLLTGGFGYRLDRATLTEMPELGSYRSVYIEGARPELLINPALQPNQVAFLLAREIGYQVLGLQERAQTSSPDRVQSFQQVLNDFRASYFAGALIMPQASFLEEMRGLFEAPTWQPERLSAMLTRYEVTPEMLLYRFSELAPRFLRLKLHFLRVQGRNNHYRLVKRLNMNRLLMPSGLALHEHYCRRWLVIRLLQEVEEGLAAPGSGPHIGVQLSEFLKPRDRFLCFGFARPLALAPDVISSAIIGFQVDDQARETIHFLEDEAVPFEIINETCERCPLSPAECAVRAAPPTVYEAKQRRTERRAKLAEALAARGK
jgi:transcriptional regulator with XRE-family HTH domain